MLFRHSACHLPLLLLYFLLLATIGACRQGGQSKHATSGRAVSKRAHDWASSCVPDGQTQHIEFTGQNGKVRHAYVTPNGKNNTLQAQELRIQCTTGADDRACTPCDAVLAHVELLDPGITCILAVKTNTGPPSIEVLSKSDGRVRIDGVPMDVFCYNEEVSGELELDISLDANDTAAPNANNGTEAQFFSYLELDSDPTATPGCWPVPGHREIRLETEDVHLYSLFIKPDSETYILHGANPQAQCLQTSKGDEQWHCNHCAFQTKYAYVKGPGYCAMRFKRQDGGTRDVTIDQDVFTFHGDEWPWTVRCWED